MEQLLKALADLLAPYLPKQEIDLETIKRDVINAATTAMNKITSDYEHNLDISSEVLNELENYDFDDAINIFLDYNNYQPADQFVDRSDCEEIVSNKINEFIDENKINEYIDESLRDEIKNVLRDATIEVIN
tara:strand:+ start:279 stop:674 length:396 start_codon:yes stop_codon:yes gene_type:complete